jgi:ubiquinone/menaquinone biosynthesis C-methylase UbiE
MQRDPSKDAPAASPLASPEAWNLVADAYAAELVPIFERFAREALRLAALPPSPRVIDAATGPGTLALLAAAGGARVTAVDFSPAMIAHLRQRAEAASLAGIDARLGDCQALPFDDESYDGAFSMFGLMFFPDRAAGFGELRRVLRPQGRLVVSSWAPFEGAFALVMESIRAMLPGLPFGQGAAPLGDPEQFAQEMAAAGLRDVVIHPVKHTKTEPSLAEFWESLQRTMAPVVLLRRKLGEQRWSEVARGVLDRLRSELGDGPIEERFTALLGVGVK